jgi:hypothetical protein
MVETKQYRQDLPVIPKRLLPLPVERGYPVPWFVAQVDGHYDFRCIDYRKMEPAIKKKLCWICGQKLGAYLAFGIGPMCCINRTIAEPPSHKECMRWAMTVCPFLIQRQEERRETHLPEGIKEAAGLGNKRQPGVIVLWITTAYQPFKAPGGILFKIGEPLEVQWFRQGRLASRAECLESIDSGYPFLLELAQKDGAEGVQQLEKRKIEAMKLLPNA